MSATQSPQEIAETAQENIVDHGFVDYVVNFGYGGILTAIFFEIIAAIGAAGELFMAPFRAVASGVVELIEGTIGGGVVMIESSLLAGVASFEDGLAGTLGPFAFPVAVLAVMAGVYLFLRIANEIEFAPWSIITGG